MEIWVQFMIFCLLIVFFGIGKDYCEAVKIFNITCDPKFNETDCQSKSLEMIVDKVENKAISDLEISIKLQQLQLNTTLNFTDLSSLTIRGEGESGMTNIFCTRGTQAGIVIRSINGTVLLQNLNLSFCGLEINSKFGKNGYSKFFSALTISHCKNVEINNVVIERSEGLGLVMENTQGGYVIMTSTLFEGK